MALTLQRDQRETAEGSTWKTRPGAMLSLRGTSCSASRSESCTPGKATHRYRLCGLRAKTSQPWRSEEHTSELQSHSDLVCRLLLEKKKIQTSATFRHA